MNSEYGCTCAEWRLNEAYQSHVVVCGKISKEDGSFILVTLDLRWVMDLGIDFGMTYGMETWSSQKL